MALRSTFFSQANTALQDLRDKLAKLPDKGFESFKANFPWLQVCFLLEKDTDGALFKTLMLHFAPEQRLEFLNYIKVTTSEIYFFQTGLEWTLAQLPEAERCEYLAMLSPKVLSKLTNLSSGKYEESHQQLARILLLLPEHPSHQAAITILVSKSDICHESHETKLLRILNAKIPDLNQLTWLLRILPLSEQALAKLDYDTLRAMVVSLSHLQFMLDQPNYKGAALPLLQKLGTPRVTSLINSWEAYKKVAKCSSSINAIHAFLPLFYLVALQPDYREWHKTLYQNHSVFLQQVALELGAERMSARIQDFNDLHSYLVILAEPLASAVVANVFNRGVAFLPQKWPDFSELPWPGCQRARDDYIEKWIVVLQQLSQEQLAALQLTQSCLLTVSASELSKILPAIQCPRIRKQLEEMHAERWLTDLFAPPNNRIEAIFTLNVEDFPFSQFQDIVIGAPSLHVYKLCTHLGINRLSAMIKTAQEIKMPRFFQGLMKMLLAYPLPAVEGFVQASLQALNIAKLAPNDLPNLGAAMSELPADFQGPFLQQLNYSKLTISVGELDLFLLNLAPALRLPFLKQVAASLKDITPSQLINLKRTLPQAQQVEFLSFYQTAFCLRHQNAPALRFAQALAPFEEMPLELAEFVQGAQEQCERLALQVQKTAP